MLILAGCGGAPPKPLPAVAQQALNSYQQALNLRERGELLLAKQDFETSYRLYAAVEDLRGESAAAINLAALARTDGDYALADSYLAHARTCGVAEHGAWLAYELALLRVSQGCLEDARKAASRAADDKLLSGRANSLLARIAYLQGDRALARIYVRDAQKRLSAQEASAELANTYRLAARIDLDDANPAAASTALQTALAIDRELKRTDKLAIDLALLADTARASGERRLEADFLRRLFVVQVNQSGKPSARATLERLATLLEGESRPDVAARLREDVEDYLELGILPVTW